MGSHLLYHQLNQLVMTKTDFYIIYDNGSIIDGTANCSIDQLVDTMIKPIERSIQYFSLESVGDKQKCSSYIFKRDSRGERRIWS